MNLAIETSILAVAFVSVLAYLIRKIGFAGKDLPVNAEWISELSLDRYRPMLRVLSADDISFLSAQPGFTRDMAKKLRRERARIFRDYLQNLETDFGRVCSAIKLIMAHSQHDRPELAEALIRQQFTFACSMLGVRFHLVLFRFGLSGVEVSPLVKIFDSMRLELRTMAPVSDQMAA